MIAIRATSQNWKNQQWIGLVIPIPKKEKKFKTLDTPKVEFIYSQSNPSMKAFKVRLWAMNGATRNNMMDKWELWEKHKEKLTKDVFISTT